MVYPSENKIISDSNEYIHQRRPLMMPKKKLDSKGILSMVSLSIKVLKTLQVEKKLITKEHHLQLNLSALKRLLISVSTSFLA